MTRSASVVVFLSVLLAAAGAVPGAQTLRLYDGVTVFVDNPDGKDFTVALELRDINNYSLGPAELLVKVYDPQGNAVVRQVIPDDGIESGIYAPPMAGWDHEAWYYETCYSRGLLPAFRWGAFSDPARLRTVPKRDLKFPVKAKKKGIYRVLIAGVPDHYVDISIDPDLSYGMMSTVDWMHGHHDLYRKSFLYVPADTKSLAVMFLQLDRPRRRSVTVRNPAGEVVLSGSGFKGLTRGSLTFEKTGQYDGQVMTLEVSGGEGDFLVSATFTVEKDIRPWRGNFAVNAVFAPDENTARALKGGEIHHDGKVFWQMYQVRYHDWLKTLAADDTILPKGLPTAPKYVSVGSHNSPKPGSADRIMQSYHLHKNPKALNAALKEMEVGLNLIGPNDRVAIGPLRNMAYEMGCYSFFYYRPAWRILRQTDAPKDAKGPIREFVIQASDRLAFCRGGEFVNGNALASLVAALRYCYEAAQDPLQKELLDSYWERFSTGGFGDRIGIGPSGGVQESFGYDYHYGSYVLRGWRAINRDIGDERFLKAYDRVLNMYSYVYAQGLPASPWNSRTQQKLAGGTYSPWDPKFKWKGHGGPDLTEAVNGHNEWFAARRRGYYAVTYHGRLTPVWMGEGFHGQVGFGGGALCQVHVPGKGQVLASTLEGSYGAGMHSSRWRNYHIHSIVGMTADGKPLVTANSEHWNAKLEGNVVTSSGEVRESSVVIHRKYIFEKNGIVCEARLNESSADKVYALWGGKHGLRAKVTEAYEMIPFVGDPKRARKKITTVVAIGKGGEELGELGSKPVQAVAVVVDRQGYGVRIELGEPRMVHRGANDTVMVRLVDKVTPADDVRIVYRILPYAGEPPLQGPPEARKPDPIPVIGKIDSIDDVAGALADTKAYIVGPKEKPAAGLRFAVAGDNLALSVWVKDSKVTRHETVWKGSCLEVFGSTPGSEEIGQVFLAPASGDVPAKSYLAKDGKMVPAVGIGLKTVPTKTGYELRALIPLKLLKIDGSKGSLLLEFQVGATARGKLWHATLFGSKLAYMDNSLYGVFSIAK